MAIASPALAAPTAFAPQFGLTPALRPFTGSLKASPDPDVFPKEALHEGTNDFAVGAIELEDVGHERINLYARHISGGTPKDFRIIHIEGLARDCLDAIFLGPSCVMWMVFNPVTLWSKPESTPSSCASDTQMSQPREASGSR